MVKQFRLYGDNIIECERMISIIKKALEVEKTEQSFISLSCIEVSIIDKCDNQFLFTLIPGYNRWSTNIIDLIIKDGGNLEESPDIILTEVINNEEKIILAVEFCSALQAGNQAWQRSGRAYSCALAKIPYLYVIDFVKYELGNDRNRKALRFPNPLVLYSYISQTQKNKVINLAVFVKAEEFQPNFDSKLQDFNPSILSDNTLGKYIVKKLKSENVLEEENILISNLEQMILAISNNEKSQNNLSRDDWKNIFNNNEVIKYTKEFVTFPCTKIIAQKSVHNNKIEKFINLVKESSIGIGSGDLPFALIPQNKMTNFLKKLCEIYNYNFIELSKKISIDNDLIICMVKGFKPRGDDNRPDRGILPLLRMLFGQNISILTYLYGPILESSAVLLENNNSELANKNGLWKSLIYMNNFIMIDSEIISKENTKKYNYSKIIDVSNKSNIRTNNVEYFGPCELTPQNRYQENDVDTVIYYLFEEISKEAKVCMCNPPGGDWSGISLYNYSNSITYKWLSLPRESSNFEKRPDHVIEIEDILGMNFILSIESKEKFPDLENNIGERLNNYLKYLFKYVPSVEKKFDSNDWKISSNNIDISTYNFVSVGVALGYPTDSDKYNCDLIMCLNTDYNIWKLKMISSTYHGHLIEEYIKKIINNNKLKVEE